MTRILMIVYGITAEQAAARAPAAQFAVTSPVNNIASILYGTPEHGQPIAGNAVILGEGFVDGERDFVSLTEDDKTNLILLLFALGISIKDESEAE